MNKISDETEIVERQSPLKLGVFWLGRLSREVELAAQFLAGANSNDQFDQLVLFTEQTRSDTTLFVRETTKYPYDTINDLQDVFNHARDRDLDFAVISFGNGVPTSLSRLAKLLLSEAVQKSIWSFRISFIKGIGYRHWPRRPHIDDHFIVLNVKKAAERGFFDRKLINGSHFGHAGGRHSHLSSMIEYSLDEGEFSNHFVPDAGRDQYGRICRFDPMPFHLCESTGFLSCYSDFKPALYKLLERNLSNERPDPAVSLNGLRYFRRGEFSYFRQLINLGKIMDFIKRPFFIGKFEFQKHYFEDKT